MAVPFLEQFVAYDKVMGHSEVKEPNTLVISLTISEATMDFLKPISSPAYVTIPVATRNKNLTKRYLGYDGIQLIIKTVLLCFRPALLLKNYIVCKLFNDNIYIGYMLTHWPLVTPYGDRDLGQHWLR